MSVDKVGQEVSTLRELVKLCRKAVDAETINNIEFIKLVESAERILNVKPK